MKYKLIKKLPFESSPEIGYISEEKMVGSELHYWNANWFDPANYPEFWEKAVEKDWEILEIKGYSGHYFLQKDGSFHYCGKLYGDEKTNCYAEKYLNSDFPHHIHSVKRLSDGEIFSVGDKLDLRAGGIRKITGISLDDTGASEFSKRAIPWLECGKDYGTCLDWAIHYKEHLLITEDGVEIFEGDEFWFVDTYFEFWHGIAYDSDIRNKYKHFSTKEAAEKYIKENKPIYSKKDMLSFGASMSSRLYPYQCEVCLEQWKKFKKGE